MPSMPLSGPMPPMTPAPGGWTSSRTSCRRAYLADATRDAHVGSYATPHMPYGALVALAFTAPP
jgi:ABC-2 type transport system permease protein